MKLISLFFLLITGMFAMAQQEQTNAMLHDVFPALYKNLPTSVANSFDFPVNKKITIKLHTTDSIHFQYSVIGFEKTGVINYADLPAYFSKDDTNNDTIEIYFCCGIRGKKQPLGDTSGRVVLVMKNRTALNLTYDIETQKKVLSKDFKPAASALAKGDTISIEMWENMLYDIRLSNFRIKETP